MKKSMISKLVVLVVVMVVAGGFAFGADFDDQAPTLNLNGTVAGVFSVDFLAGTSGSFTSGASDNVAFSIVNDDATDLDDIFKVQAISNAYKGFTVTLSYDGVLEATATDALEAFDTITYELQQGATTIATDGTGTAVIIDSDGVTSDTTESLDLYIAAPADDYYAAGDYTDTVTVTLSAK